MRNQLVCRLAGLGMLLVGGWSGAALAQENRLDNSPRHLEWVDVPNGDRTVRSFVAYPEVPDKAHAVIVIHEIFGLTDWVRGVADQLAEAGYIAIAPDLLSGMGPNGGGSEALGGPDGVRGVIGQLPPDQITADLNAVAKYVTALPAANGTVSVGGFCWGGGQSYRFATNNKDLKAAYVFYGSPPDSAEAIARINCPVYGFYGENDARIDSTIPNTVKMMQAAGKTYEPVIYQGAGHGFMRAGEQLTDENDLNRKARNEGWERWKTILTGLD
ncbi:MAG: dienelactone hydrolase family protein [Pirellulales bacterium]